MPAPLGAATGYHEEVRRWWADDCVNRFDVLPSMLLARVGLERARSLPGTDRAGSLDEVDGVLRASQVLEPGHAELADLRARLERRRSEAKDPQPRGRQEDPLTSAAWGAALKARLRACAP